MALYRVRITASMLGAFLRMGTAFAPSMQKSTHCCNARSSVYQQKERVSTSPIFHVYIARNHSYRPVSAIYIMQQTTRIMSMPCIYWIRQGCITNASISIMSASPIISRASYDCLSDPSVHNQRLHQSRISACGDLFYIGFHYNRLAEIPFTKNSIRVPNAHSLHHDGCFFIAG